jgi:hypothetical protein
MESSTAFVSPIASNLRDSSARSDEHSSGVSWGAVFGGAFVTISISLIMLALGAGFGLSVVSPWSNTGASASEVGTAAIVWLVVDQVVSCALGGYLVGRLRTKWVAVHTDEVYFRDTANGFLAWAVAVVISVGFVFSSASLLVNGFVQRASSDAAVGTSNSAIPLGYFVDRLYRSNSNPSSIDPSVQAETSRLLTNVLRRKEADARDEAYLAKLVVARTGLSPADAEKRVSEVEVDARSAEDVTRQAAAHMLLWSFLALLIGAFCASFAATIGGRQRDHMRAI